MIHMKRQYAKKAGTGMALLLLMNACSDAPKQYDRLAHPPYAGPQVKAGDVLASQEPILTGFDGGQSESSPKSSVDQDELARANSRKPIFYGVGAGGITLQTEFSEAQTLLEKPLRGPIPNGAHNLYLYPSGMIVFWRKDPPVTPEIILIDGEYVGTLEVGGKVGSLSTSSDLKRFFSESDPKGEGLINELYRQLEKTPADYQCLSAKVCEISDVGENWIFTLPGAQFLISKDRKVLFRMLVRKSIPQGKLDNPFDLASSSFAVNGPAGGDERITLGEKWGTLQPKLGVNPPASVSVQNFSKNYSGIYLYVSRSKYAPEYREPEENEWLRSVVFTEQYHQPFLISGKNIQMKIDPSVDGADDLKLSLVSPDAAPATQGVALLDMSPRISNVALQQKLVRELSSLIASELRAARPDASVQTLLTGFHGVAGNRSFGASILQYSVSHAAGLAIRFSVGERNGNVEYLEVSRLDNAFTQLVFPAGAAQALLGKTVTLSGIDIGRGEATMEITDPASGKVLSSRVAYDQRGLQRLPVSETKIEAYPVGLASLSDLSVTFGVSVGSAAETDSKGSKTGVITSVSGAEALLQIEALCLSTGLEPKIGTPVGAYLEKLKGAKGCSVLIEEDPNDNGRVSAIHFPKQNTTVIANGGEITSIRKYSRPAEVRK